jgi:hypothetical protein
VPKNAELSLVLGRERKRQPYLARLHVVAPRDGVPVDLPQYLRVEATDATGGSTTAEILTWRSLDTLVGAVSPDGLLTPRTIGSVRVVASAGGWRADTARVEIVKPQAALLVQEDWSRMDTTGRWAPFGEPRPIVRQSRGRRALLVNGDSSFSSGVHERVRHRVSAGVAVHTEFSLISTAAQWQTLNIAFLDPDSAALAAWDHRKGSEPIGFAEECGLSVPRGEGYPASTRGELTAPAGDTYVFDAQHAMSGSWVTLDVQLFPDGTCGVALDGKPMLWSRAAIDPRSTVVLHLQGKSWRTIVAVGRTEIWSGVRPGIDWSLLRATDGQAAPVAKDAKRAMGAKATTGTKATTGAKATTGTKTTTGTTGASKR